MSNTSKIKSITGIGVKGVWDITVKDDHSYLAQGFINHNSSDPVNFQNQPRDKNLIRKAFCTHLPDALDKSLMMFGADYSQVELRVVAHLANELNMIEVYGANGICTHNGAGAACQYYAEYHECLDEFDKRCKWKGLIKAESKCPSCDSSLEWMGRCRHVDLHQRTAEDAGVARNPLAKCLDGSTLVWTGHGLRPIESLIKTDTRGSHVPLSNIVLSDGREGWVKAKSGIVRDNRPTKIVVTKRSVVVMTNDHRIQVIGDNIGNLSEDVPGYVHRQGYSLVEAKDLKKGMKLPFAEFNKGHGPQGYAETAFKKGDYNYPKVKINPFKKTIGDGPIEMTLNEDWAYFAGIFAGDGCASGNACVITHGSGDEYKEWRDTVKSVCDNLGLPNSIAKDGGQTRIGSRSVRRYLQGLGLCKETGKTGEKVMRVPEWVFTNKSLIHSYIAGLFDTDGTVGKKENGTVSVTTAYPEFAGQIAMLLRWLGYPILVQPGFNKIYKKWYYTIHVLGEGLARFLDQCPMRFTKKVKRLQKRVNHIKRKIAPTTDEVLLVIDGGNRTVYDFHVTKEVKDNESINNVVDDHLYLQGGLIGHNNLNFGCLYRIGPRRFVDYADLYTDDGEPRIDEARDLISRFYNAYPFIPLFHKRVEHEIQNNDWIAYTLTGRRRRLKKSKDELGEYKAVTQGIQFSVSGSAQDIMKSGMIKIHKAIKQKLLRANRVERKLWERVKFLLQVHDEVVMQGPRELENEIKHLIKTNMENAARLAVPLTVDVKAGRCWDDIH